MRRAFDMVREPSRVSWVNKKLAILQLAKQRQPALLILGQTVSNFGDGVALIALTLLVLDTTHSVTKLAWFAAARITPTVIFLLVGGVIVDRFSRRLLLLISDVARAVLSGGLVVLIGLGDLHFWELMVFGALFGTFDAVFGPAITAITPELVPEDLLQAMNAVRPLSNNVAGGMIGPAVGGFIYAIGASWAIGVDCATFLFSAACLFSMHPTPAPVRELGTSMFQEAKEGIAYVRQTRWIWTTLLAVAVTNAFVLNAGFVLLPFFLKHTLHTSGVIVGYAFAMSGISGSLGALIGTNLKTPKRRIRVMWTYWTISCLSALIIGVATNYWEVFLFPLIVSPTALLGNVIWESMLQSEVPRTILGRVSSVDFFVSFGLGPIGLVLAGWLSGLMGIRTYFVVFGCIGAVPGIWILLSKRINAIDAGRVSGSPAGEPLPGRDLPDANPSSSNLGI
jgi:DHA3 family tetracycline resistance protein-like MFS transporter